MARNKRTQWQKLGYKSYAAYKNAQRLESQRQELVSEWENEQARNEAIKRSNEQRLKEAADRQQYHNLRLKGL